MSMSVIHGDIIEERRNSLLFAINGDPDDTIFVPLSVVLEREPDETEDIDILVETWWYNKNEERF